MKSAAPQIVKPAERLMLDLEQALADFPKKHRFTLGSKISDGATEIVLLAQQAFRASRRKQRQADLIEQMSDEIDRLRIRCQLAFELQCFSSAGRFDGVSLLIDEVGRQCGAWKRQVAAHLQGQSPVASAPLERPVTLSPPAASTSEAYP